jgi:hypothetical protein
MLATGVHAQAGVYALLLGSGISTAAGIPTGWGIVTELVRRAAAARNPEDLEAADRGAQDPEAWWAEHGDGQPLGYSNLLASLARTPAARRALLAGFFEPSQEDLVDGLKTPTPAHGAIAALMKRGLIRVVVTTNFDRLLERALEDAGLPPQVVTRPEAVGGMTSLTHAPATVIKIHGDYADLEMRNTVDELGTYPEAWSTLLRRVFDEYGVLVCGWSADWDKALVGSLEATGNRRYPLYWDSRSSKGEVAKRLIAQHSGIVVPATSADDLFTGLLDRIKALDRLAEPPLTSALAEARLKRYLPDPTRRIDLHDLVLDKAKQLATKIESQPLYRPGLTADDVDTLLQAYLADTTPLIRLVATGIAHDRDRAHTHVWIAALQRLMSSRTAFTGTFQETLDHARHYPALLLMRGAGIIALHTGHDDVLLRLLTEATYRDRWRNNARLPAVHALHDLRVLDLDTVKSLPRWNGTVWLYPSSHLLKADLRDVLRDWLPDDDEYTAASHAYEYRAGLLVHRTPQVPGAYKTISGEYVGETGWTFEGQPHTEIAFLEAAQAAADDWPWWDVVGGRDALEDTLTTFRDVLKRLQRWG